MQEESNRKIVFSLNVERVKELMKREGFKQIQLAQVIGLSKNQLNRILAKKTDTTVSVLRMMAHYLNADYTELISGETAQEYANRRAKRDLKLKIMDGQTTYGGNFDRDFNELIVLIKQLDDDEIQIVKPMVKKLVEGKR